MTLRYLLGAVTAAGLVWSMNVGVASAQTTNPGYRDGGLLPSRGSGPVIVAGCLIRGDDIEGGRNKYALGNPVKGPIESVAEETCSVDFGANGLTLDKHRMGDINDTLLGRMVEIEGRLERESGTGSLRELDVWSVRLLPKTPPPPQVAVVEEITIEPAPAAAPAPEPAPVPTSGVAPTLPQTAGAGPTIGLIGLFALGASLVVRTIPATWRG